MSMSLPDDLLSEMDAAIARGAYRGRSEFLRQAARSLLQERHAPAGTHVHGSITTVYGHDQEARVSEVRHAFHDIVLSLMHTHCEPETCMDVLLVGGSRERIEELQETLARMRPIHRSHLAIVA